jgi:hypothetical protein
MTVNPNGQHGHFELLIFKVAALGGLDMLYSAQRWEPYNGRQVAQDTSGPASLKLGDIAQQQASRPDSPDRGKLRVFISYSRDDLYFADQLDAALNTCGFECVIDRHGISGGEDWKRRLGTLISEADTVVFVLSPTSARSEICAWEVEEATRLGKRILPYFTSRSACRGAVGESLGQN